MRTLSDDAKVIQDGQVASNHMGTPCRVEVDPEDPFGARLVPIASAGDPARHDQALGNVKPLTAGDILALGLPEDGGGRVQRRKTPDFNPMTKKILEKHGWLVEKCETYQVVASGALVKHDLFGIADYIAIKPGQPILLVQACASGQLHAHLRKFRDISFTRPLLSTGHARITVITWDQPGGFGSKWVHGVVEVTEGLMDEFDKRKRK